MAGNAGKHVFEPPEKIDAGTLARGCEAPQYRAGLAAFMAAEEYPVVASQSHAADRAFGGVMPTPGLCRAFAKDRSILGRL
jgi:hypothetical protein